MKKLGKFIFASLSVAAFAGGAYYLVKNIINKDSNDEFDDFEDDFDDFDLDEDEDTDCDSSKEERGYVTLSFQEENDTTENEEQTAQPAKEENNEEANTDTETAPESADEISE